MTDFLSAAHRYLDEHQWATIPLIPDASGLPKRPFSNDWQHTTADWDTVRALPWHHAQGIGIVLGAASDNLAAIDIDQVELAAALLAQLQSAPAAKFYYVKTGRDRCHVYFREGLASPSKVLNNLHWGEYTFGVELKASGTQIAAPPTPGYTFLGTSTDPTPVARVSQAWEAIRSGMGITGSEPQRSGSAGYPAPWRKAVTAGERNNSVYVEACRLAEAKMPLEAAIETMLARMRIAYEGATDEQHTIGTIRSAYRRVLNPGRGGRGGVAV